MLSLTPDETKSLETRLKIYEDEKTKAELYLDREAKYFNETTNALKDLNGDDVNFNMMNITSLQRQQSKKD